MMLDNGCGQKMVRNDYIILWLPFGNERCLGGTSPMNCLMGSSSN